MATTVKFLDPKRVRVETSLGDTFILGFNSSMNFQIDQQWDGFFTKCVTGLFDKYYKGDESVIWGPIAAGFYRNRLNSFIWVMNDRDKERERIGRRIKELRNQQSIDAKTLAQRVGIDAGNLSRIEQGKFSVGIDILNKIASALNMRIDFVPQTPFDYEQQMSINPASNKIK